MGTLNKCVSVTLKLPDVSEKSAKNAKGCFLPHCVDVVLTNQENSHDTGKRHSVLIESRHDPATMLSCSVFIAAFKSNYSPDASSVKSVIFMQ